MSVRPSAQIAAQTIKLLLLYMSCYTTAWSANPCPACLQTRWRPVLKSKQNLCSSMKTTRRHRRAVRLLCRLDKFRRAWCRRWLRETWNVRSPELKSTWWSRFLMARITHNPVAAWMSLKGRLPLGKPELASFLGPSEGVTDLTSVDCKMSSNIALWSSSLQHSYAMDNFLITQRTFYL